MPTDADLTHYYKGFVIQAFEHQPERWKARIWKANGAEIRTEVPVGQHHSLTSSTEYSRAADAITWAVGAVDGGGMS